MNELFLHRVLTRDEWHEAKYYSPEQAIVEFSRLRRGYEEINSLMTTGGGPQMIRFRTDQLSPQQIADRLYEEANFHEL